MIGTRLKAGLRGITPSRVALVGWMCCMAFVGERAAIVASEAIRANRVYLCEYGTDCLTANVTDLRCCRDAAGADDFKTTIFTCRASCRP